MKKILLALGVLLLAGCSVSNPLQPYRIDIQQGNVVTQEMVAKLRSGMTKAQVRFILGTPLLTDIFHANRWDYVYRYQKAGKLVEDRKLTLYFEGDLLYRVAGDVVAGSSEELNETKPLPRYEDAAPPAPAAEPKPAGDGSAPVREQPKPEVQQEEKGFFGKILEKVGL